jgi:hypothetical protein
VRLHVSVSDPDPVFIRIQAGLYKRKKFRNFMFEEFSVAEGFSWSPGVFCRGLWRWNYPQKFKNYLSLKSLFWIRIGSEFSNSLDPDPKLDQQNDWIRIQ